jgi:TetR/AcrR family transcriptional regulator, transcriptional repressor of aconitase
MPKVSDEHKRRRHEQILRAARRCFARYGYEGATVARLEKATGLSRGAIFNYFPDKEALFLAVAVETTERMTTIWLEQGFRALLDEIVREDPEWLSVQLEAVRRVRTDKRFQRRVEEHERRLAEKRPERLEGLRAQGVRTDVPIEAVGIFLGLIANGLALRVTMGDEIPELDLLNELVEHGVAPRPAGKPRRRATSRRAVKTAPRS